MGNGEQTYVKRLALQHRLLPSMRWLRLCLRRAATSFFFNSKKKEAKNAALMRREACTAQIAFVVARHALACEGSCKMDVGCEMDLRAVRDGFVGWSFGMAFLQWLL